MSRTDIRIRGRSYSLACSPGQEMRVQGLARQLDTRLDLISSAVGDIGDERLLLIAALALLDELDTARSVSFPSTLGPPSSVAPAPENRAARMMTDMAVRIEALAARLESGGRA